MPTPKPLTDAAGEVRELTAADLAQFKPAAEVLPPELLAGLVALKKTRGPQQAPTKVPTTIRFDPEVLAGLKATGKGWQTRVNEAVREWLKSHSHTV